MLIPAFTRGKSELSAKEVEVSWKIASVRIHIEKVIGLWKNIYTILQRILPLRLLKSIKDEAVSATLANYDKIVTVCAALANLGESIVFSEWKICFVEDSVCLIHFWPMLYLWKNQATK